MGTYFTSVVMVLTWIGTSQRCLFKYYTWTKINFCDPISFLHCMTSSFRQSNGNVGRRHINCCVEVVILANRQYVFFKSVYRVSSAAPQILNVSWVSPLQNQATYFFCVLFILGKEQKGNILASNKKTASNKSTKIAQASEVI